MSTHGDQMTTTVAQHLQLVDLGDTCTHLIGVGQRRLHQVDVPVQTHELHDGHAVAISRPDRMPYKLGDA